MIKKVKFWEDNWLGPSSLAIQFWEIYVLVNEKSQTIFHLWDGTNLKCTFRRGVNSWLINLWLEVVQLASTIVFTADVDSLIQLFTSNGVYSSQPSIKSSILEVLCQFMFLMCGTLKFHLECNFSYVCCLKARYKLETTLVCVGNQMTCYVCFVRRMNMLVISFFIVRLPCSCGVVFLKSQE